MYNIGWVAYSRAKRCSPASVMSDAAKRFDRLISREQGTYYQVLLGPCKLISSFWDYLIKIYFLY